MYIRHGRKLGDCKANRKRQERRIGAVFSFQHICNGILVLVLGLLFTRPIASLLGADTENMNYTCDYLRWIFIGAPAIMLSNGLVHSFRSVGLVREATIGLALGNAVSILLDWIFIVLMNMGTKGAALATSVGFICAAVYYLACLLIQERKNNQLISVSPSMTMYSVSSPGKLVKSSC